MTEIKVKEKTTVNLQWCSQEALDSFGFLEAVKVNGDLDFYRCKRLTKLPVDLKVAGELRLNRCTELTELPDDLIVGGGIYLYSCEKITKLPRGLIVGEWMNLGQCKGITKLPKDLTVFDDIWYNPETGFSGSVHEPGVIPVHLKHKLKNY
jgi:hypothetical protein